MPELADDVLNLLLPPPLNRHRVRIPEVVHVVVTAGYAAEAEKLGNAVSQVFPMEWRPHVKP